MTWGTTILIALLTSVAGAGAAGLLASLCVEWYGVTSRQAVSGFLTFAFVFLGLFAGLLIGAVTSRFVSSGLWNSLGYSIAILVLICFAVGIAARANGEVPPELGGETLMLEVELRCPRQWQPDNAIRTASSCSLQPVTTSTLLKMNRYFFGEVDWNRATQSDGQWIAPCEVPLGSSRPDRNVFVNLGHSAQVSFQLPLPASPGSQHLDWTPWSNQNFNQPAGYDYRVRVKKINAWRWAKHAEAQAAAEEPSRRAALIPEGSPVDLWLPLFEYRSTRLPSADRSALDQRALAAIRSKALDLAAPLQSSDQNTVLRAIYATSTLNAVPTELIAPLAKAGLLTIDLVHQARANAHPNDPDLETENLALTCFLKWNSAMELAGASAAPARLPVLEKILAETSNNQNGDLGSLRSYADQYIARLSSPPAPASP